jgi:hypothetical protein
LDGMLRRDAFLRTVAIGVVLATWLAALVLPPVMLWRARADWLEQLDRPEAQSHWDAFRRDMRQQSDRDGPVQRKVPKSAEPPARVWLRDYFRLAVVAWVLFVGVLGGFFSLLIAGVLRGSAGRVSSGREGAASRTQESSTQESFTQDEPCRQCNNEKQHERDADDTE